MPASSVPDLVSTALHNSFSSPGNSGNSDDLDIQLIGSAKRVLLTEIKYEQTSSYSSIVLDNLKSKCIVFGIDNNKNENSDAVHNGLKDLQKENSVREPHIENSGLLNSKAVNSLNGGLKLKYTQDHHKENPKEIRIFKPKSLCNENGDVRLKNGFRDIQKDCKLIKSKEVSLPAPKRVLYPPDAIQLGWRGNVPVGSGLANMGNTCYLNSTLQALFHIPSFVNWLLNDKVHTAKCEKMNGMTHTECLICAMANTLQYSQRHSGSSVKPTQIYSKLNLICKHLVHGHQEDAHEFLRYLIESMERSYLRIVQASNLDSYSKETTPLNQIFGGYLRTEVTCLECNHVSTTFQHFQDLLIDIRQISNINEGLDAYFSRERLDGEEAYKCEQCHKRVAATKKFSLEKPPNVLCVQLKRFGNMGGKNSKSITIHHTLDLTRFHYNSASGGKKLRYRLVSLVSHIGSSSSCGHYTAIGQTSGGQFYHFDDSSVRSMSINAASISNAYIIMYEMEPPTLSQLPQEATIKSSTPCVASANGPTEKMLTNGNCISNSSSSISSKSTTVTTPTKSPHLSQPSSSVSPKPVKLLNGHSPSKESPCKSLVPYAENESSDSETEIQPCTSKQYQASGGNSKESPPKTNSLMLTQNKNSLVKESSQSVSKLGVCVNGKVNSNVISTGMSIGSTNGLACSASKVETIVTSTRWQITDAALHSPSGSSTNSGNGINGNWSITEASSVNKNDSKIEESQTDSYRSTTNGRTWNGNRHNETVDHLLKLSHRGYGSSNVNSWNGDSSQIDREAERERQMQKKRSHDQLYDEELDRGKAKKIKNNTYSIKNDDNRNGRRYNAFQEHQNRKNVWQNRQQFYYQYTNQYRGAKMHQRHSGYQNRNNYNRWH